MKVILVVSLSMIFPAFADTSSANFSVIVPEVNALEIVLSSDNVLLDLTPTSDASAFGSAPLNITVGTSNVTGYNLSMTTTYNNAGTSGSYDKRYGIPVRCVRTS